MAQPPLNDQPPPGQRAPAPALEISRGRRVAALFLTIFIVLAGSILALEAVMRVFVNVTDVSYVFWDPVVGLRREPNQSGRMISGVAIDAHYHFNAQGWNHPVDYTFDKPDGARRVCLVGDSQVEAHQVDLEQNMAWIAQEKMSRPDRVVQWYPFGSSGLGTSQEYAVIRHYALDYQPDVVVLLYIQNDPFDCSPYLSQIEPYVATYYLDPQDELQQVEMKQWTPVWWRRIASVSALVRYFYIQKKIDTRIKNWGHGKRAEVRAGGLPLREEVENVAHPYLERYGRMSMELRNEKTWMLTEKLLAAARDECARRGAKFAIAFRGWPADIDAPLHPNEKTPDIPHEDDPYCLGKRINKMGPEILAPMAARLGVPYLDLTEAIRAEVARQGKSHRFPDDNHFNALGHEAAGRALAEWVQPLLIEPSGPAAR